MRGRGVSGTILSKFCFPGSGLQRDGALEGTKEAGGFQYLYLWLFFISKNV